jgi:hypothetical protein
VLARIDLQEGGLVMKDIICFFLSSSFSWLRSASCWQVAAAPLRSIHRVIAGCFRDRTRLPSYRQLATQHSRNESSITSRLENLKAQTPMLDP